MGVMANVLVWAIPVSMAPEAGGGTGGTQAAAYKHSVRSSDGWSGASVEVASTQESNHFFTSTLCRTRIPCRRAPTEEQVS